MTKSLYSLQVWTVNSLLSPSLWLSDLVNLWPSAVRSLILLVIGQLGSGNLKDMHWNGLDILILQAKEWKTLLVVNSVLPLTAPVTQLFCKDKTCSLETQLCITVPESHSVTNCCKGWTKNPSPMRCYYLNPPEGSSEPNTSFKIDYLTHENQLRNRGRDEGQALWNI